MFNLRLAAVGIMLAGACEAALAADVWNVENNFDRDFKLVITPAGGAPGEYELKAGDTVSIRLGADPHSFTTSLATGRQRQIHREKRLRPVADDGLTQLKDIRTPLDIRLPKPNGEPGGEVIYQAMPDFPYDKSYEDLVSRLKQSRWFGQYDRTRGSLALRGNQGTADLGTRLENIQYVPGDTFYVVGEWKHAGERGEFILAIDPQKPNQLTGYYRYEGRRWSSGTGQRLADR